MARYIESSEWTTWVEDLSHQEAHTFETCKGNDVDAKEAGGEEEVALGATIGSLDIKEPKANEELNGEKEVYMMAILERYTKRWLERTQHHMGYPINMAFNYEALDRLQQFALNNCGDPFAEGTYGVHSRDFEVSVLDWFADLWKLRKDEYWGYITTGGTEGILHGMLIGREMYPDGILYASNESHYAVLKAAHMYRMKCIMVDTLVSGEIDCGNLKASLLRNNDKPAIMVVNIGTTVKGAIDDLDLVIQTLNQCGFPRNRFYIHCDAALFGVMLPFQNRAPQITFKKQIDSISVSGHKFVGCPMPCGVQIIRKEHTTVLSSTTSTIEYIFSKDVTITGSRNGHVPIFLWYALNRKGRCGLEKEVQKCLHNARYLNDKLKKAGISAMLNEQSNIVVFERPHDEAILRHWQLLSLGKISHVIVMPHVTIAKIDSFIDQLVKSRLVWLKDGCNQPPCVASEIGKENCVCPLHNSKFAS